MTKKTRALRKLANIFFLVCMSMVSVLLVWIVLLRFDNYDTQQSELAKRSLNAAANEVGLLIEGYQRSIRIFAEENQQLLGSLVDWPQDIDQYTLLEKKLKKYFPEHFTFTLSNFEGKTLLEGFEGLIGENCRRDIHTFAASNEQFDLHIHKGQEGVPHHFDIMSSWSDDTSTSGVFFVSFKTITLERILNNTRVAGHQVLLVRRDEPGVVDVISQERSKQQVTEDMPGLVETGRNTNSMPVSGTSWNIVVRPDDDMRKSVHRSILLQTLVLFLGFLIISLILRMMLLDEE